MQTSLQVLSDLLRGLMALAAHSTDVSDLPACHSLARGAQGRLEKLWDLWTEFNEWAGKE